MRRQSLRQHAHAFSQSSVFWVSFRFPLALTAVVTFSVPDLGDDCAYTLAVHAATLVSLGLVHILYKQICSQEIVVFIKFNCFAVILLCAFSAFTPSINALRHLGDRICLLCSGRDLITIFCFCSLSYRKFDNHCGINATPETKGTCNDRIRSIVVHIGFAILFVQSTVDGHSIHQQGKCTINLQTRKLFHYESKLKKIGTPNFVWQAWTLGDTLCKIFPVIFYSNVAVSLLSMVGITLNR